MFQPSIKLNDNQIEYIKELKHVFVKAEGLTQVPWQLLASIWERESSSVAPPKTPGGPMQFDPPPCGVQISQLLKKYSAASDDQIASYIKHGVNDFETAVVCAGGFLRRKMNGKPIKTDDDVMLAAWLYNGQIGNSPMDADYVSNGFDPNHQLMHIRGTLPDGHGGRIKIDKADNRPGVFTSYMQLKSLQI